MIQYKKELRKTVKEKKSDKELLGELYNIYYNNSDLKLLLDLLAESSGVAPSLRIMTLFDKEFRAKCQPTEFRCAQCFPVWKLIFFLLIVNFFYSVEQDGSSVTVSFGESPTIQHIFAKMPKVRRIFHRCTMHLK